MEYSVLELIKQLIKRWYLILIVMCITAGVAVCFSKISYKRASEKYNQFTTEIAELTEEIGKVSVNVNYDIDENSITKFIEVCKNIFNINIDEYSHDLIKQKVLVNIEPDIIASFNDEELVSYMKHELETVNYKKNPTLSVEYCGNQMFKITIDDVKQEVATSCIDMYLNKVLDKMRECMFDIEFIESDYVFISEKVEFAQTIMREPIEEPNMYKVITTGAIFGFAIACIGVLIRLFLEDMNKSNMNGHDDI